MASNDDILVHFFLFREVVLPDDVFVIGFLARMTALSLLHGFELLSLALFLRVSDLLETSEVLTSLFIELVLDVRNRIVNTRNKDELECVDTSVCNLQSSVNGDELGLERGNRDENLEELGELLLCRLDRRTTTRQTQKSVVIRLLLVAL